MRRIRHLIVGPLPPIEGGITILFSDLVQELIKFDYIDLKVINTNWVGRSNKLLNTLHSMCKAFFFPLFFSSCSFHLTARALYIYGPIMLFYSLFGKKIIFRKFAGSFDLEYEERGRLYKYLVRKVMNSSSVVLLETDYLVNYFSCICVTANIKKFPNHRNLSAKTTRNQTTIKKYTYLYLGSVNSSKGIDLLLSTYRRSEIGLPEIDIYGNGDTEIINQLKNVSRLNYKGVVNNTSVLTLMQKYNYLILPTKHKGEGIPGVIIECMSCGVVPLVSSWRALPEIVNDKNGRLFLPNDIDELENILKESSNMELTEFNSLSANAEFTSSKYDNNYWVPFFIDCI